VEKNPARTSSEQEIKGNRGSGRYSALQTSRGRKGPANSRTELKMTYKLLNRVKAVFSSTWE